MPKNQRGGRKHKRGKKRPQDNNSRKNVELAENGQEYAKVLARLGGSRLEVECTDGKKRQAIIPGKFKRRIWMNPGDILLVSVDAVGDDSVCAVDRKYNYKEIVILRQKGLIKFEDDDTDLSSVFKSGESNIGKNNLDMKNDNQLDFPSFDSESDEDDIFGTANPNRGNNFVLNKTKGTVDKAKGGKVKRPVKKEDDKNEKNENKQNDSDDSEGDSLSSFNIDDL